MPICHFCINKGHNSKVTEAIVVGFKNWQYIMPADLLNKFHEDRSITA